MRFLLVVVGVAVMVVGAVLLVIPIVPNTPVDLAAPANYVDVKEFSLSGSAISITDLQPITGSWTSNASVLFEVVVCASRCLETNSTNVSSIVETGTSGTFAIDVPQGDLLIVSMQGASGTPVHGTVNFTTALTLVGSAVLIVGIVLIVLGYFLRAPKKRGPPARGAPPRARPAARPPTITVEPTRPAAPAPPSPPSSPP